MHTPDAHYYLHTALQSLEKAYADNRDLTVAAQISHALEALHRLANLSKGDLMTNHHPIHDPYEMDKFNSAV